MSRSRTFYAEIFLVSFAAILLEISYTRFISFKLFYYYTYVIIGLSLLGIGAGGIIVAIVPRLQSVALPRVIAWSCLAGGLAVGIGYFVVALTPFDSRVVWSEPREAFGLLAICLALFPGFVAVGLVVSTLLARRPDAVRRLYAADLLGAGLACAVIVPLIAHLGPPACIFLASAILALVAARSAWGESRGLLYGATAAAVALAGGVAFPELLPEPTLGAVKTISPDTPRLFSKWSPVFRIDVTQPNPPTGTMHIHHDGLQGSTLHHFDGHVSKLRRFEKAYSSYPFKVLNEPPESVLIIGAAGGHEMLASLYFGSRHVTGIELNPVTFSLVTNVFADFSGHLQRHPQIDYVNDEGRSYLARQTGETYDLIYFVAPDSYSAMNAATAGAFVLSESYLYTVEMIVDSLQHLTGRGIICMQFGEFAYDQKPNRTARYVASAREAFRRLGIPNFDQHVLVGTSPGFVGQLSTILLKRQPFDTEEEERFFAQTKRVQGSAGRYSPGRVTDSGPVNAVITLEDARLENWFERYAYDVRPVSDDAPFFWHFVRFETVLRNVLSGSALPAFDLEDSHGEMLLLLLLGVAALLAGIFLLLPFLLIRDTWLSLPRRRRSTCYFAAIGLGFMFFEISLIQRLTLFLGYPTYSLTVTLMAMLLFTGVGSLLAPRRPEARNRALRLLLVVIVVLALFYWFGLDGVMNAFIATPLVARAAVAMVCVAPLGLALGMFMPLGLSAVAALTKHGNEYVAWSWAVNGFFSVLGSVLTTMLSMSFGFDAVLLFAIAAYGMAVASLHGIPAAAGAALETRGGD